MSDVTSLEDVRRFGEARETPFVEASPSNQRIRGKISFLSGTRWPVVVLNPRTCVIRKRAWRIHLDPNVRYYIYLPTYGQYRAKRSFDLYESPGGGRREDAAKIPRAYNRIWRESSLVKTRRRRWWHRFASDWYSYMYVYVHAHHAHTRTRNQAPAT